MIKITTVVGARPQFVKAAAISREIRDNFSETVREVIVHTGQHHDENMSQVFFDQLDIPRPDFNLEIAGGRHGEMTGRMLGSLESVFVDQKPDWVLVYGDTNSTLAGALAAAKLHIPVAHVEAGLRSFNMRMPEEINRILTDRVSSLLFCPTETAVKNLRNEGMAAGIHQVGDVMFDVAMFYGERAREESTALTDWKLAEKGFALATCHRAENTDDPERLEAILAALAQIAQEKMPVVLPLHPRTRNKVSEFGFGHYLERLVTTGPLGFLDMIAVEQSAQVILTDSGGVQKEAFFFEVPCVTMREETEWVETVELGWNTLAGADRTRIVEAFVGATDERFPDRSARPYGDGSSARDTLESLLGF